MSNIGCLMWGVNLFLNLSRQYNIICKDPERKSRTVYFAVYSIIATVIVCGLFALSLWGLLACLNAMGGEIGDLLLIVFIVMLAVMCLVLTVELIVGGLMGIIYQFRCNKRPIGYVALAVYILSVAALIVGIIFIINTTGVDL